jgi:hypothetical protein
VPQRPTRFRRSTFAKARIRSSGTTGGALRPLSRMLGAGSDHARRYRPDALIRSAAFSAIMMMGMLVLAHTSVGITEPSTTRNPSTP